jgi:hypothetical protein
MSKNRNRGPPSIEVIAPTGKTTGEIRILAKVSDASRITEPASAEAGIRNRWSSPTMRFII